MKDISYYECEDLEYPIRPKKPFLSSNPTKEQALSYAEALGEYEENFKKYEALRKEYQQLNSDRLDEFKKDLAEEYGYSWMNESIIDVIYNKAWDDQHHCGLSAVASEFEDLCGFVSEVSIARGGF